MFLAWSALSHYLNQCWNIVNWTLRNKLQWILIEFHTFSFRKMRLKMSAAKCWPFFLCLNVLICGIFGIEPLLLIDNVIVVRLANTFPLPQPGSLLPTQGIDKSSSLMFYVGVIPYLCPDLNGSLTKPAVLVRSVKFSNTATKVMLILPHKYILLK